MKHGRAAASRVRDKDAAAFFTTAGITNPSEQIAINQLILKLKERGLWNSFDCVFPISKTSLNAALYCAKSLIQMTAVNNPTFSASGITFDGATQYLDTGIQMQNLVQSTLTSSHLSCYLTGSYNGTNCQLLGASQTISATTCRWYIAVNFSAGVHVNTNPRLYIGSGDCFTNETFTKGFLMGTRSNTAVNAYAYNSTTNTSGVNNSSTQSLALTTNRIFIGASSSGTNTPIGFAPQTIGFASFGGGFTQAQANDFAAIVQEYQIMMGRAA